MALSDLLHSLLFGIVGRTSLSLWSIAVASVAFYFTTLYIRKWREYQVKMSPKSEEVEYSDSCFRQTLLSASSMVVYLWKLYYPTNGLSPWIY